MKKRLIATALCLALLPACSSSTGSGEGEYSVYFLAGTGSETDAALEREFRKLTEGKDPVEGLMYLLLAGPESDGLTSPFPQGTTLRSCQVTEDGVAVVDLSEAYEGLSGAELTQADGCVVLTLCQLEEVRAVYLTVEGHPRPFRDQVYVPENFLLDNTLDEG